jgi:hypothetical protein
MRHVHFGAGHFGLGFSTWLFCKAKIPTTLVARVTKDPHKSAPDAVTPMRRNALLRSYRKYLVSYADDTEPIQDVEIAEFVEYEESTPDDALLVTLFQTDEPICVTFSLGGLDRYEAPIAMLRSALREREIKGIKRPVFLMAFEDRVATSDMTRLFFDDLEHDGRSSAIVPLNVSVDRFCYMMKESAPEVLEIETESYAALVVEEHDQAQLLKDAFSGLSDLVKFSRYVQVEKNKTRWIVNGSRALIALTSDFHGITSLRDFLSSDDLSTHAHRPDRTPDSVESRKRLARAIIEEMSEGFRCFTLQWDIGERYITDHGAELDGFVEQTLRRFLSGYDTTSSVIQHFVVPPIDSGVDLPKRRSYTRPSEEEWTRPRIEAPIRAYIRSHGRAPMNVVSALINTLVMVAESELLKIVDVTTKKD